jgi:hypothetical protein
MYTPDFTVRRTHQWEVVISNCREKENFSDVEKNIITEIERLSQLYWDLEALGLIENGCPKECNCGNCKHEHGNCNRV